MVKRVKNVPDIYHRHSIRLKGYDYSQPGGYFVTLVAYQRDSLFGTIIDGKILLNRTGEIVKSFWENIPSHYANISLDSFIIMPNHIHGIVIIDEFPIDRGSSRNVGAGYKPALVKRYPLSEIVRNFKTYSSRTINEMRCMPGVPVWQRNYHERVIRNDAELDTIREYIDNNVLNWNSDNEYQV